LSLSHRFLLQSLIVQFFSSTLLFLLLFSFFLFLLRPPPRSTLFPYTTLFRSHKQTNDLHFLAPFEHRLRHKPYNHYIEDGAQMRSEEHTSELQSRFDLVCRLLLEKKKKILKHKLRLTIYICTT